MRKISFVVAAALVAASFSPSIAAGPSAAGKAKMKKGEANIACHAELGKGARRQSISACVQRKMQGE